MNTPSILSWLGLATTGDIVTTKLALEQGFFEAMPATRAIFENASFVHWIFSRIGIFLVILLIGLAVVIVARDERYKIVEKLYCGAIGCAAIFATFLVANNLLLVIL